MLKKVKILYDKR